MKFIIITALLFSTHSAFASYACFVDNPTQSVQTYAYASPNALQCSTTKNLGIGSAAVGLTLQAGSLYLACTGVGAPAALWVQGASLGISVFSMVVAELPCDDSDEEAKVKELARKTVCETLAENGIACAIQ